MSSQTSARVDLVSSIVIGAFGLFTFLFGVWALVDAASFYDNIAKFGQYNRHFLHDVGAFQMGLRACLLFALVWRDDAAGGAGRRDGGGDGARDCAHLGQRARRAGRGPVHDRDHGSDPVGDVFVAVAVEVQGELVGRSNCN